VIAALVTAALQHPKLQQQLASHERWLKLWLVQQQQLQQQQLQQQQLQQQQLQQQQLMQQGV
jgi:hypothetical protein